MSDLRVYPELGWRSVAEKSAFRPAPNIALIDPSRHEFPGRKVCSPASHHSPDAHGQPCSLARPPRPLRRRRDRRRAGGHDRRQYAGPRRTLACCWPSSIISWAGWPPGSAAATARLRRGPARLSRSA